MNTDELRRLHAAVPARKWVMSVDLRGVTPDEATAIALFVEACTPARILAMLDVVDAARAWVTMPFGFDDKETLAAHNKLEAAINKLDATP